MREVPGSNMCEFSPFIVKFGVIQIVTKSRTITFTVFPLCGYQDICGVTNDWCINVTF